MIHLKQVTKVYPTDGANSVTALRELTLVVQRGDFVVIKGRSGSGKTTALNLMAGLTRPTSGLVELEGVDLWSLPDRQQSAMRNYRMGFVFQFPSLLPSLTVLENVILPTIFGPGLGPGEAAAQARNTAGHRRPGGQAHRFPPPAFSRPAATGGHRAVAHQPARNPHGRRAHQQSRRTNRKGNHRHP